ncbi:MAG: hypothetical protein IH914_02325 [candidate division Zixibacteria bacterium]|nr:hypothetical protein [candidate division Zixibacteria bacterium]
MNEAGNQSPLLAVIGAQATTENVALVFSVSATDPDNTTPSLIAQNLPAGALFTDNGNGTGSFDWTPDFTQSGLYSVTFIASDGVLQDSELVTITVAESGNQTPVLAAIGPKSVAEGANLNFAVSASDPDGVTPSLSATTLPTGSIFTDNGNGTGTFDWTPDFTQSGTYLVTFIASDGFAADSEIVTISVNEAGNQKPALAAIGAQSVTENTLLSVPVSATDPDGSIPNLSVTTLPPGASFVDNGDGTGSFDWTPTFVQQGLFSVTFIAADGVLADSELVIITVIDAGNQAPVLAAIGAQSVIENANLNFAVSATDAESIPSLTALNIPAGASFTDNGNGTGSFNWTPNFLQAGIFSVTFIASDDSLAADSEIVSIAVIEVGNQAPVLAATGAQSTTENIALAFPVSATDAESTPALNALGLPTGASFTDNGNGTGSFNWTPNFLQSGIYNVTFTATDDSLAIDSELVTITVLEGGNQTPVLAPIGPQTTTENVNLVFAVSATDIESIPALSANSLPPGATFTDNGNGTGSFGWTPTFLQSGSFDVTFTATDDSGAVDLEIVTITVIDGGNQTPILNPIGAQSGSENVNLVISVSATDVESVPSLSVTGLPGGATFTDNGNGTGSFNWTPTFLQSGVFSVTFSATDDSLVVASEIVSITISEAGNQLPILSAIGAKVILEGTNLSFVINSSDIESIPTLSASPLPAGAVFTDNGDGTGAFAWTPTFIQAGVFSITFSATDDSLAVDSEVVSVTVTEAGNQAPVLAAIGPQTVIEGILLSVTVSATDAESTPTLTTTALPGSAAFIDNGDGTGLFTWTPTFIESGVFSVSFIATDADSTTDVEVVSITVTDAGNQLPALAAIGPQSVIEGVNLNVPVSASDAESIPTLFTSGLPPGATFTDNGDGTGIFDWTPGFTQSGTFTLTFFAQDDSLAATAEVVTITVADAGNQAPVLAPIGPQVVAEGFNLNVAITATDAESIPTLTASNLPAGATFVDQGGGSGVFDWTPTFLQQGIYSVIFVAADDSLAVDSEFVTITVTEGGNQAPVLAAIGAQSVTENINLNFAINASDLESVPTLSAAGLPAGATFIDNLNGTGVFDWTPTFLQSGVFNVIFTATDDSLVVDSEVVVITVIEGGNQLPALAAIVAQSTTENVNLSFAVSASDIESIPSLSAVNLPAGAVFTDNANGTGAFNWTPDFLQSGTYNVTFIAVDDSLAADSETVVITVIEGGNQLPILALIGPQSTTENLNLNFAVSASDIESIPSLSAVNLPAGASFTDNLNGTGLFDWTPTFLQSGVFSVTFIAVDDSLAADSEVVVITVSEGGNQLPVLALIGAKSGTENVNLNFAISAADIESVPALSAASLPSGATFTDNLNGTGVFNWTPDFTQSGVFNVTFKATDDSLAVDSEVVTITISNTNRAPVANAGVDQAGAPVGTLLALDGTGSSDPDLDPLNYNWTQVSGTPVILSSASAAQPTFTTTIPDTYVFSLVVDDGSLSSAADLVQVTTVSVAPPQTIVDLDAQIAADAIQLTWTPVTLDTNLLATTISHYVIYRGTRAYFIPLAADSIGFATTLTVFTDNNIAGANTVGDTLTQYFYTVQSVDIFGNRSAFSNRVGEYDYQIVVTATTNFNFIAVPFTNTGLSFADDIINAIGVANVLTVNTFVPVSQSYQSRFAVGFGVNFAVTAGGIYQVNAAANSVFSVAGRVPPAGSISYPIIITATTNFNFLMVPFERELDFSVAQNILDNVPGVLNTLSNFVAASQSYQSRFAIGFGVNFPIRAGRPYQGNAGAAGVFPGP